MSASTVEGEHPELKAGHPPAVKVGGVRVAQSKREHAPNEKPAERKSESEQDEELIVDRPERADIIVSGAKISEERAFPTEAIKHFHEKPIPTHENRPNIKTIPIQQPRGQNY